MAAPDPARIAEITALWLLLDTDLQEMNERAMSIATGSKRVLSAIESPSPEPSAAQAVQAQMKAVGEDLMAINLKAISLGRYTRRLAALTKAEAMNNHRQAPDVTIPEPGAMN